MRLPDSFLDELRARTPLAALIGRRVKLVRSGRQWKACCPFHGEKTPSFYVYDDAYHCFGCGAHGDGIGFVMQSQGATFMEAVEQLAGEAGLDVPKPSAAAEAAERQRLDLHDILQAAATVYQQNLFAPQGAPALAYLRGRGLTDATIRRFGLGWSGEGRGALAQRLASDGVTQTQLLQAGLLRPGETEDAPPRGELFFNRVMFPIRDQRGRAISFGGRILGDGQPKYVNGPETAVFSKRRTLYGLDFAREAVRTKAEIIVVEGYLDVVSLHQAGFSGAVAPLGTALTDDQLQILWQLSPDPILCFDGDAAGRRAAQRAIELALPHLTPERAIHIASLPDKHDPDSLIRKMGKPAFEQELARARASDLASQIFAMLKGQLPADTMWTKAKLTQQLEQLAGRIGNRNLSWEFKARFRALASERGRHRPNKRDTNRQRRTSGTVSCVPLGRPLPAEATANAERLRTLTAILLRHPALLPRLEDAYTGLPLPPAADRLHTALQPFADDGENLDFDSLIAHLRFLRLAEDVEWALGEVPFPLPACAGPTATASQAEAGWWYIYGLMRRGSLEDEVAAARRDFAATPSQAAQQRLISLSGALESSRRGDIGPDTVTED